MATAPAPTESSDPAQHAPKDPASEPRRNGAHLDRPDVHEREQFTISDLTSEFGCTARALRFYEDEGLIKPRRQGMTRLYSVGDRTRLGWILRGKRLGFSLAEIRELLDLYQVDRTGVQQLRELLRRSQLHIADLERKRADLDQHIAWLRTHCQHDHFDDVAIDQEVLAE